jgi:GNAT superfamily N-acetyltransferase
VATLYQPSEAHHLPTHIHLRLMQPEDEVVFRHLYAEVRAPELRITPWSDVEKQIFCDGQYTAQDNHYRAHYADLEQWAVCHDSMVIGRMYLATFKGLLILMDITIAAVWRGQGIGSNLLTDVVRQADLAAREMHLHVEPDNPARRLYQRLGFVELRDQLGNEQIYLEMRRAVRTSA